TGDAMTRFYRNHGATGSVGNVVIPIPMGRMVGGTTAINTGTCWRTPEWVLKRWADEGLSTFEPSRMSPYFEKVEQTLSVGVPSEELLGGVARVVARGCDALGYSHRPVSRNAPGCKGSGVCNFGCPTGSKQSTNLSYVPAALQKGARLVTGAKVDRILFGGMAARGVEATLVSSGRKLRVNARAVVLACGTLLTPSLLHGQGIGRNLPTLGKNLSIHPATAVSALFDEEIRGFAAPPQGYCVDELHRQGILAMGATAPIDLAAGQFSFVGTKLTELMESYDHVASFGVMVEDRSRGRVSPTKNGGSRTFYWLGRRERDMLVRGMQMIARIFLEAGAKEIYPATRSPRTIRNRREIDGLSERPPKAADLLLSAFHPLGTARMATSPERGVVSPAFEVFGTPGLYIADGSVVPGSPAVNPQVTIMALATLAAESISEDLGN
ncbi:MAG: GMC family oxidoreductase N-terminal domain-containing protein, partial [Acidimicrobiia bacterium]